MKKGTKILLSALCIASLGATIAATGCSSKADITITGSSSVSPLMSALAEEYMKSHEVNIVVQTSDSGTGIADATNGNNSFGMASRDVRASETGVTSVTLCMDGVALIVNTANTTVTNVTSAEIYDLYVSGTAIQSSITNAITRETGSGTRDAFDGFIKNAEGAKLSAVTKFANVVTEQNSTGGVMEVVEANAAGNTIGYISLGSLNSTVKALQYEGTTATVENVQNGTYALSRPFNIVYNTANGLDEMALEFLRYVFSVEGQTVIESKGGVPLAADKLAAELAKLG